MIVYILLITIFIEFLIAFAMFEKNIVSPACIFSATFIVAVIDLIRNVEYWGVELHWNTYAVMAGGILSFIVAAAIVKGVFLNVPFKRPSEGGLQEIIVGSDKIILSLLVNGFAFFAFYRAVGRLVGRKNSSRGLAGIISAYRVLSITRIEDSALPGYVNYLNIIVYAVGTIWVYILVNNYIVKRKVSMGVLLNLILVFLNYFITGSRGKLIYFILSIIPMFYLLWCAHVNRIKGLPIRYILLFMCVLLLLAFSFKGMALLTGRNVQSGTLQHISINLSAPILNFDEYVQRDWSAPPIWGFSTFSQIENSLGRNFGFRGLIHRSGMSYRYGNGHPLGNVATTFYSYYHDFNKVGVVVLCGLMGLISQIVYEVAKRAVFIRKTAVKLSVILFSDIFIRIAFSFFSDRFYERFCTISFGITFMVWIIAIWIGRRVQIVTH